MPELYRQLVELRNRLETHYKEVQDYEYTIEKGVLYCLQTRNGKMNAQALVRSSVDMVREGLVDRRQALMRIQPEMLEQLLFPHLDPKAKAVYKVTTKGTKEGDLRFKVELTSDQMTSPASETESTHVYSQD